jgi:acetyl esterase/lipase
MKKTIISMLTLCLSLTVTAQPQGGPGGFHKPENTATFKNINYAGDKLEAHQLDIYLPEKKQDSYKVIVLIYGSAWFANNAKVMAYQSIGKPLVDAGFAVVSINHRSSGDAKFPAQIHDVKAALRFIRANAAKYKLDTSFIGITGYSSGGHLSSLAGVTNGLKKRTIGDVTVDLEGTVGGNTDYASTVDAVVDWFGPVDMAHMENCQTVKDEKSPKAALMGCAPAEHPDLVALISPITYVNNSQLSTLQSSFKEYPRFLVIHGDADGVVPYCQSERFAASLKKAGQLEDFVTVPKGQHGPVTFNEKTFKQMTDFFLKEAAKQKVVENGGTGAYKAVMKEEPSLPAHTVFVPKDMTKFNATNPLPVLVWGNGACTNSPWEHFKFLNEIASHGFLVIATGYIPMEEVPYHGEMSTTQQQVESIDWAIAQNEDPQSPYYQKIAVNSICAAGMSCGGLQTLYNCADPRLKALMICNSGLFKLTNASQAMPRMPMPDKAKLKEIHTPVFYILGGKEDIAYENGMDDYRLIKHVPAAVANYPVGHGGTYRQPHGGEFSPVALAWLQWQLKGDKEAAKMFTGKKPGLTTREGWTYEKNKKMK